MKQLEASFGLDADEKQEDEGVERDRVYPDINDDPIYLNFRREAKDSLKKCIAKYGEPTKEGVLEFNALRDEVWDNFVQQYPDKASSYMHRFDEGGFYIGEAVRRLRKKEDIVRREEDIAVILNASREKSMDARVINVDGNELFSDIIVFDKKEISSEKTVRLYRGVDSLDSSVFRQVPYGMKEIVGGEKIVFDNVEREAHDLAENPTYKNFTRFILKLLPSLSESSLGSLKWRLEEVERSLERGLSLRTVLESVQVIDHLGGEGVTGVTPYLSASTRPSVASGYAKRGLLVIDIPLSEIEISDASTDEVCIKGVLDKKYITAILPQSLRYRERDTVFEESFNNVLERLNEIVTVDSYGEDELNMAIARKKEAQNAQDIIHQEEDLADVKSEPLSKIVEKMIQRYKADHSNS